MLFRTWDPSHGTVGPPASAENDLAPVLLRHLVLRARGHLAEVRVVVGDTARLTAGATISGTAVADRGVLTRGLPQTFVEYVVHTLLPRGLSMLEEPMPRRLQPTCGLFRVLAENLLHAAGGVQHLLAYLLELALAACALAGQNVESVALLEIPRCGDGLLRTILSEELARSVRLEARGVLLDVRVVAPVEPLVEARLVQLAPRRIIRLGVYAVGRQVLRLQVVGAQVFRGGRIACNDPFAALPRPHVLEPAQNATAADGSFAFHRQAPRCQEGKRS